MGAGADSRRLSGENDAKEIFHACGRKVRSEPAGVDGSGSDVSADGLVAIFSAGSARFETGRVGQPAIGRRRDSAELLRRARSLECVQSATLISVIDRIDPD